MNLFNNNSILTNNSSIENLALVSKFSTSTDLLKSSKDNIIIVLKDDDLNLEKVANEIIPTTESGTPTSVSKSTFKVINKRKSTKSSSMLHNSCFAVLDLETVTHNSVETPFIIGVSIQTTHSKDATDFLTYTTNISEPKEGNLIFLKSLDFIARESGKTKLIYIYAHNGAKFDTKVLLPVLTSLQSEGTISLQNVLADGMRTLYEVSFLYGEKTFVLRDSLKILGASVKALSKIYLNSGDQGKLSMDINIFQLWVSQTENSLELLTNPGFINNIGVEEDLFNSSNATSIIDFISFYCITDCKVVLTALNKFSISMEKEGFLIRAKSIITISSVAMKTYITNFYNMEEFPIATISSRTVISKFIKEAYIGGRTEVLGSGINISPIYHFDIPGIYAQCIKIDLPYGNPVFIRDFIIDPQNLFKTLHENNIIGFFKATVTCPSDLNLPVLGNKSNGKLTFNTGTFSGTWTSNELELALNHGYSITLKEGYVFKTAPILADYSRTITSIKDMASQNGDTVTRAIAKLLSNSLYGKFASSYHDTTSRIVNSKELAFIESSFEITTSHEIGHGFWIISFKTKPIRRLNLSNPHIQALNRIAKKSLTPVNTNIPIAAAITSYGRIILYNLWVDVVKGGGTLLYSDTDSIFASFPEAPYNKIFGGFVWPNDPNLNDTFNKALFIAPKIYYLEKFDGTITFKVKGVGNPESMSYDDLVETFMAKEKLVFKNQIQFKNLIKKGEMKGIMVRDNITKAYDMHNNVKREWVNDNVNNTLTTMPIPFKDAKKRPLISRFRKIENKRALIARLNTRFVFNKTNINDLRFLQQEVLDSGLGIVIKASLRQDFERTINHVTARIAANRNNLTNNNVIRIVVTLIDLNSNIYKTVIHITPQEWTRYTSEDILSILNDKFTLVIQEYNDSFNPNIVTFKLITKDLAFIIDESLTFQSAYNKSTTSIDDSTIKQIQLKKRIDEISRQLILLGGDKDLPKDINMLQENDQKVVEWKSEVAKIVKSIVILISPSLGDDYYEGSLAFNLLYSNLLNRFYIVLIKDMKVTVNSLAIILIKVIKWDMINPNQIKAALTITWTLLSEIIIKGYLLSYSLKSQNKQTKEVSLYTAHTFYVNSNTHIDTALWLVKKFILNKVSLTPIHNNYLEGFSQDIAYTLDKLNRTPIKLNIPYLNILLELSEEQLTTINNTNRKTEYDSLILAWSSTKIMLLMLAKWYQHQGEGHFYMKYMHDFRGRLYPELTQVSHMSHKFLRPLFITRDRPILKHDDLLKYITTNKTEDPKIITFINLVKDQEVLKILKVDNFSIPIFIEFLDNRLREIKKSEVDWKDVARLVELKQLITPGIEIIPSPVEYDAKASVLQHSAVIAGDEKLLAIIGIIEKEGISIEDIYRKCAKIVIRKIDEWIKDESLNEEERETTLNNLMLIKEDLNKLSSSKLRKLVKKPIITSVYNASHLSIWQYIKRDLERFNLNWSKEIITLFVVAVKAAMTDVISSELNVIKIVQKLVHNYNLPYSWIMSPISDFTVYCDNPIKETLKVKVTSVTNGYNLNTNMNIIKPGQNQLKSKNRIFVNIIHACDALHIALIIKNLNTNILPIHDAILVRIDTNVDLIKETINSTFQHMHKNNQTFKSIVEQVQVKTGNVLNLTIPQLGVPVSAVWNLD